jgi:hypothetical protein
MAIDTSTLEATLQAKFDAVTDPKEMLLLGKAYESTVGGIAISDIEDAGAAQVATINSVATSTFKTVGGESILGTGDALPSQTGNAGKALLTDGTNLSWGVGGRIIQVVSTTNNTVAQYNIYRSGTNMMTASITPTSTSSKILILASFTETRKGSYDGSHFGFRRGATTLIKFGGADRSNDNRALMGTMNMYLDSPNTTSATNYSLTAFDANDDGVTLNWNRPQDLNFTNSTDVYATSSLILVEVAG